MSQFLSVSDPGKLSFLFSRNNLITLLMFGVIIFSSFGCGLIRNSGVPVPEMDTTETGIATGAVIGAGMGALVGSVSGQAGMGLVVGSLAGAATGGVVGKSIEYKEKGVDNNDSSFGVDSSRGQQLVGNSPSKSSSSRSRLWTRVGEVDPVDRNRPSGAKGIAARYNPPIVLDSTEDSTERYDSRTGSRPVGVSINRKESSSFDSGVYSRGVVQLQQDRPPQGLIKAEPDGDISGAGIRTPVIASRQSSVFPKAEESRTSAYSSGHSSGDSGPVKIELQKPKPELPDIIGEGKSGSSITSSRPSAKTNTNNLSSPLSGKSSGSNSELPPARERAETQVVQRTPKASQKSEEENTVQVISLNSELPKAANDNRSDNGRSVIDSASSSAADSSPADSSPSSAKTASGGSTGTFARSAGGAVSSCEKGKKEVERAKNSPSDSDRVFYLRRAILACPDDAGLRVELGKVYGRLGLKDDARKEFTAALESDPGNDAAQDELSIMMLNDN
ncbi:MAG TPA: glycine zipper domain-containing protein [Oligoflexia bacterium]|nr:glycine zipper domain-containing protein [Oligoflexia bacterium]HMP48260.1 glycine zipper domain-containing protein [Oligoflexia bacterium]